MNVNSALLSLVLLHCVSCQHAHSKTYEVYGDSYTVANFTFRIRDYFEYEAAKDDSPEENLKAIREGTYVHTASVLYGDTECAHKTTTHHIDWSDDDCAVLVSPIEYDTLTKRINGTSKIAIQKRDAKLAGFRITMKVRDKITNRSDKKVWSKGIVECERAGTSDDPELFEAYLDSGKSPPSEDAPGGTFSADQRWYLDPADELDVFVIRSYGQERKQKNKVLSFIKGKDKELRATVEHINGKYGDSSQRWIMDEVEDRSDAEVKVFVLRNYRNGLVLRPKDLGNDKGGVVVILEEYDKNDEAQLWNSFRAPDQWDKYVFENLAREKVLVSRGLPRSDRNTVLDFRRPLW